MLFLYFTPQTPQRGCFEGQHRQMVGLGSTYPCPWLRLETPTPTLGCGIALVMEDKLLGKFLLSNTIRE